MELQQTASKILILPDEDIESHVVNIGESLTHLSLPRLDFNALVHDQIERARELGRRALPSSSWKQRLVEALEGPWAPDSADLPERPMTETAPNHGPYRQPTLNASETVRRQEKKYLVNLSQERWALSPWTSIYEYEVPIRNLPPSLHDLKILHLSDIHFLKSNDRAWREMATIAKYFEGNSQRIDLILLSGDVITKSPADLCTKSLHQLARLSAVCPQAFMVYGNHDYHGHVPALISRELERVGFHDINNHHVRLTIGNAPLNIYGVDDAYFGKPYVPESVASEETNIVLTHNLDAIRGNFPKDIDLILSGHTHWGELKWFDASHVMTWWGYCDNINRHTRGWEALSNRSLSFVHPGLARYYVPYAGLRHPPGVVLHTLIPHHV